MGKLTPGLVRALKPTDKHRRYGDGDGLSLVVRPNGSKGWQVRLINPDGSKTDKGLGAYPQVKLGEARRKAKELLAQLTVTEVVVSAVPTFKDVADLYLRTNEPTWKHPRTAQDIKARFRTYAYPSIGSTHVNQIKRRDVMGVLEPMWTSKPSAAKKMMRRMRSVFTYALANDWIAANPVDDAVASALPKTPATKQHLRALPYQEVGDALLVVASSTSGDAVKLCFKWLVLTAARSGEARGARWDEIDLQAKTWTIPASRMKAGQEHRVPLSTQAVEVVMAAMSLMDGSGFLFPSINGKIGEMTLTTLLRTNGLSDRTVVHGFRTSFKTWCMETTDTPWAVGEAALAHSLGNSTEQAYARSDLFDRRRGLMQEWADHVERHTHRSLRTPASP